MTMRGKSMVVLVVLLALATHSLVAFDGDFLNICRSGTLEEIKAAIADGASLETVDGEQATALMYAGYDNPDPEVVRYLVDAGARVDDVNEYGMNALMHAASNNSAPEVFDALVAAGSDLDAVDTNGWNAVVWGVLNPNPAFMGHLLERYPDRFKHSLLELTIVTAAFTSSIDNLTLLMAAGADPNQSDINGLTALMYAAWYNPDARVVQALLESGSDVNAFDVQTATALIYAAAYNPEVAVIDALLQAGAHVDPIGPLAMNALMWAAARNTNPVVVERLLEAGSPTDLISEDDLSLLELAQANEALQGTEVLSRLQKSAP